MDAHARKLHEFLSQASTKFLIPIYQRNYEWGEEHCRQLLEDILAVGSDSKIPAHFIGSITYVIDTSYSDSDVKEFTIIDGQQRLTTATLIYIVLFWLAKDLQNFELAEKIEEQYLTNKYDNSDEKLKLRATDNNKDALRYLLRDHRGEDYKDYSRLIENFNFFKKRINEENIEAIQKGLNKLMYVDIKVERDKDDPQKIYESMNSTGLGLGEGDKIRNSIFMGLQPEDQNRLYKNYWLPIEDYLIIGVSKENKITDFMRDFLTIETKQITPHNSVYRKFKQYFLKQDTRNVKIIQPLLVKLKKYASFYNKLNCPQNEKDPQIQRHLNYINKLEIDVSYPFLIRVYNDYSNKDINKLHS